MHLKEIVTLITGGCLKNSNALSDKMANAIDHRDFDG